MGLIGRAVLGFSEDGLARAGEVLWYISQWSVWGSV